MNADNAHGCIAEIEDDVLSGRVSLDGKSMERILTMLVAEAERMNRFVTDKCATAHYLSLLQNAEIALPEATDEFMANVDKWQRTQDKLRRMQKNGRMVGAMLISEA